MKIWTSEHIFKWVSSRRLRVQWIIEKFSMRFKQKNDPEESKLV